jgi:ribosomal protein S18 acetylase RimI-like enzyme
MVPSVRLATLDDAALVHAIMRAAFAEYVGVLLVSSSALGESVADVRVAMEKGGAVIGFMKDEPVGSARFRLDPDSLYVGRVAVLPTHRRRGIASAMIRFIEEHAPVLGREAIHIVARESLPSNIELYRALGYELVSITPHPRGPDREYAMQKRLTPRRR